MAERPSEGGEHSITVEPSVRSADDKATWKQLKRLNDIVFYIELLEYLGNAIGTVAMIWATVVLLGGFCSYLTGLDFWFATVMVFLEGTRVFVSKDASVNQWLFGSTRAFRWDHFCFSDMHDNGNLFAVIIGMGISLGPIEFGSQIITGILKVAILAITSLLLTRTHWNWFAKAIISLFVLTSVCGSFYGFYKMGPHKVGSTIKLMLAVLKFLGIFIGWLAGTLFAAYVTGIFMTATTACSEEPRGVSLNVKVIVALGLVYLPILQAKLGSKYRWLSISIAAALLTVNLPKVLWNMRNRMSYIRNRRSSLESADKEQNNHSSSPQAPPEEQTNRSSSPQAPPAEQNHPASSSSQEAPPPEQEQGSNALLLGNWQLLLKIVDTIMPILFFWGVMFPLPGIPLKMSFYMLLSVITAVLVGNLQIPVAFLQILLSGLRLQSLLAGHGYHPLPDGTSPNLVPSIVIFFLLELCQGLSSILGIGLGLFSFGCRRSLVNALGVKKEEWLAQAVSLYYHQACMTIKEKGLFPMEKSTPPSFDSFAVESLGCTSSEMQTVRLHLLNYYLRPEADSRSKRKLMAQIAKDATGIVTKIAGTMSDLITDEEILISRSGDGIDKVPQIEQIRTSLALSLKFVGRLAVAGGKIGTRFREELSRNPILLHSLQRILDLKHCQQKLWEPALHVIKLLALDNEVMMKLVGVFLNKRGDDEKTIIDYKDYGSSLRKAAGEVLANLTITSSDNCKTMLDMEEGPAGIRDLIKDLVSMLQLQDAEYKSIAANLLKNLYANSGDMLINLNLDLDPDAKQGLESALGMEQEALPREEATPSRDELLGPDEASGARASPPAAEDPLIAPS